jgi:hypothetical protein
VEPERFDDVASRVVEAPEPPRRPPHARRWAVAVGACLLTTGALAAGASALGGGDEKAREAAPATTRMNLPDTHRGTPFRRDGRDCEGGKRFGHKSEREHRSSELRH